MGMIERKKIVENMSNFLILCDELIDNGIIQTLDSEELLK